MSIHGELLDIREYDKVNVAIGLSVSERIEKLNYVFDEWVFTRQTRTDKIDANRINDLFGKSIEV